MKKLFLLAALMAVAVPVAWADVTVTMRNSSGCYYPTSTDKLPAGAFVQLIWSLDNAYATPLDGAIDSPAGDFVLFSGTTVSDGGYTNDMDGSVFYTDANVGGNPINSGYLYIYIYQDGTPQFGDFYGRSSIVATSPGILTNLVNIAPAVSGKNVLSTYTVGIVPEPSSIALLLVGLGLIGYRKLRT